MGTWHTAGIRNEGTAMEQDRNKSLFESIPVPTAVRIMALPTIIVLNHFIGMYGIVWSQVTADILTVALSALVYFRFRSRLIRGEVSS